MKKNIAIILAASTILCCTFALSACGNKQIFDTTYTFNRAILTLPDGTVIDGKVERWTDYEDGDQIQVKIDGVTYLVHSSNICLIAD